MSSSIITIQLGQCGNQAGCALFELLSKEYNNMKAEEEEWNRFFRAPINGSTLPTARSVLIDMEPKVIQQTTKSTRSFKYDPSRFYFKQSGSGNNWAFGYNVHGPASWDDGISDLVRKEVECCDCLGGFLFVQSLGGGTGSGLGTFTTNKFKEEYPNSMLINQVVLPYSSGEVIVQNYNTLLSLSDLYAVSDAVILMENDQLSRMCSELFSIKNPSFEDLNGVIADQLSNVLLPSNRSDNNRPLELWYDVIDYLCCHPNYRLLHLLSTPQVSQRSKAYSNFIWSNLVKNINQMLITDAKMDAYINWGVTAADAIKRPYLINKSVGNILFLRGDDVQSVKEDMIAPLTNQDIYCKFNYKNFMVCTNPQPNNGVTKCCSLLSNSQSVIQPIQRIINKASEMYQSKAYLHQYEKYSVTADHFEHCMFQMDKVVYDYQSI
ncbi:tubulin delta [Acrasis kona]|uniref:Tubulin delta chain n=1 Tax=Acrasis kona TaxID=1008807 RepID=A0AAW2ZR56_9EUKA